MQREPKVYVEDIYAAAVKIENFTNGLSYDEFLMNIKSVKHLFIYLIKQFRF